MTRQAIEYRRNRYEWQRDEAAAALCETPTGQRVTAPQNRHDRKLIADGKRSLANMRAILEALSGGASARLAAQRVGIGETTLKEWLASDLDFARLAKAAEAEAGLRAIERVKEAGTRGDWRADAYLLERMPVTRDDFAPRPSTGLGEGPPVTIQLVMRAENLAVLHAGAAVDRRLVMDGGPMQEIEGSVQGG